MTAPEPLSALEVERMRARDREWSAMTPTDFLPTWSRERLADAYFVACLDRKWLLLALDAARVAAPSDGLREAVVHPTPGFPGFDHAAGTEPERCSACWPDLARLRSDRDGRAEVRPSPEAE